MSLALALVKFEGAGRAIATLERYMDEHPGEDWPRRAGVISRHRLGRISIFHSLLEADWDIDANATGQVLGAGALTGVFIGALAGPLGIAVGAALGGAIGAIVGARTRDEKPLYQVIRDKLEKNTSAAVLLAAPEIVDRMVNEIGPEGVETLRWNVSDELQGHLERALLVVARAQAPAAHP